ncbi:Innexin unc-7 [Echinococcus granulosus]|uniref:Innexin n=1 Tax=Echinococcus granulosus TaxID=6210 RepID=U6J0M5_ECHGR|nr:Innexin unc-7 [Echinococcus granulosus]EUB63810.1 Innexin unc-7 [Echinococcus granulosus]CDS15974.1 innexin unc 9 [Echinococcus granulosus]
MVGKEFIDLFRSFQANTNLSVDDFADRLNLFTVILLLLCTLLISMKQYVFNSISCYIPVQPSGSEFKNYLADYCWVHGTIPLRPDERMPSTPEEWNLYDKYRRITYYQWVPFVLGLQCIIFYLPHLLWEMICNSRASGDVFTLIQAARKAASGSRSDRKREVHRVAEFLEDMIDTHQCSRRGRKAKLVDKMYDSCGLCVVSKRMGTCLVWSYITLKVVIILNAALQLHLIQVFLGFTGHYIKPVPVDSLTQGKTRYLSEKSEHGYSFGWAIASYIRSGQEWPETLLFPRVAYCRVPSIRLVGGENAYTAQCTLPINMLNEKIYIFLWFWVLFLLITSLLSLLLWIIRATSPFRRYRYIARFLRVCKVDEEAKRPTEPRSRKTQLQNFVDDYLRQDGVFLVRMLAINAGEVLAADVVGLIWQDYRDKRAEDITSPATNPTSFEMKLAPREKIQKIEVGFV